MPVRFFGQYLLEHGVIQAAQLLSALAYQDKINLKFGDTAIALGLLTPDQLRSILALQRAHDFKTGEAAIFLGYLTPPQVTQVLRAQQNSHVMLGEALIATGALSRDDLTTHLAAFQADQEPFKVTIDVPTEHDPTGLGKPAVDLAAKFLTRVAQLRVKLTRTRNGPLDAAREGSFSARVPFTGSHDGVLAIRAPFVAAHRIAQAVLGAAVQPEDRATLNDAVREFLNMLAGNLSAALARQGKKFDILPPASGDPLPTPKDHMLIADLSAPEGVVEFCVLTSRSTYGG